MESLHIKLDTNETINSKRKLLYTEMALLNILKRAQEYKNLRTLELKNKTVLRTSLRKVLEKIRLMQKQLPKAKIKKTEKLGVEKMGKVTRSRLERELKEIRDELEKIS